MNTAEFLRKILPSTGLYVVARLVDGKWRHQVCDSIAEATAYTASFDAAGVPTYHACAAYRDREVRSAPQADGSTFAQVRVHKNVRALKAYWMDLDVKPEVTTAYESQGAALEALVDFCRDTALPMPMVISSGGGIHVYWTLTHEILPEAWKPVAQSLKALCHTHGFRADPACTADPARVLRSVGTWNRKVPASPRAVELVAEATDCEFGAFERAVGAAIKRAGVKPPEPIRAVEAQTETINQAFAIQHDFPPCSGEKVATRCAQVAAFRDAPEGLTEPHFYAVVQLLAHAVEGDELIHQWASKHPGYSRSSGYVDGKIAQIRQQKIGPPLCSTLSDRNPGGCEGCPFLGKISSPAQLGTIVKSAPAPVVTYQVDGAPVVVTMPLPPNGFTRGENGGIFAEVDGITHKIYEYDCYPTELAYDEQLGYETVRIRHWLPQEGWRECVVRSSLLARPVDFETQLRDKHIQPLIRNQIAMYFDAYLRKIRTDTKMRQLFRAQGWKNDDTDFVLGDKLYAPGSVVQAGFSHAARGFLEHFKTRGDIHTWRTLTSIFQQPGLEPHAFMLLTAFAAPLLKLAGRQGFTVSALGDTGAGKSAMGSFLASVYGHPNLTWIKRNDTALARMQRIGAYYSLPVYMDEVTTILPKELRDLVYTVATGKGRDSMKADYTLREGAEWATILVTSTNDSLQSKLQLEKANAEAESMRLFEFRFPRAPAFTAVAGVVYATVAEHYGVAGEQYIRRLVDQRSDIKGRIVQAITAAETAFGMDAKERFWSQAVALTLLGGDLAREWGLIDFDPQRIRPWLLHETQRMRKNVAEGMVGSVAVLGQYLNEHAGERIVVTQLNAGLTATGQRPMRELSSRYEKDTQTLWISRGHIKFWMDTNHFNYNEIKDELESRGILLDAQAKKVLGMGTDYTGGQVPCWKVQANHPELGALIA